MLSQQACLYIEFRDSSLIHLVIIMATFLLNIIPDVVSSIRLIKSLEHFNSGKVIKLSSFGSGPQYFIPLKCRCKWITGDMVSGFPENIHEKYIFLFTVGFNERFD